MTDLVEQLRQGGNLFALAPAAVILGALHGLEPGHSKTMMAAFIVAVRGTVAQAVLLGVSATVSHTAVVWAVAMAGLWFGDRFSAETVEPYLQLASGIIVIGIAAWMFWRVKRGHSHGHHHDHGCCGHDHSHGNDHDHGHHDGSRTVDTGHGVVRLEIDEADGRPPRFRLYPESEHIPGDATVVTEREDGARQTFRFVAKDGFLESTDTIPEPHAFIARLRLAHGDHSHDFDIEFTEDGHLHAEDDALDLLEDGSADAHERAHAHDIRRRFANRNVTTGQIVLFGLTGGLIPCPAAATILLLCLQLKKITLGATLVLGFSIGLALTLVLSGVLAALSLKHVSKRWSGFGAFAGYAPYLSVALMTAVGIYMMWHGYAGLAGHHAHP